MRPQLAANFLYYPVTRLAGERVRHYVRQYAARDHLDRESLLAEQQTHLYRIIQHARQHSPFYFDRLTGNLDGPDSTFSALVGLPLLEKADLRNSAARIMVTGLPERIEMKTTSGSTGHPLTVAKNCDALARERAATWRGYSWAGISVAAPQGLLWGQQHSAAGRLRSRLMDFVANRKRLSVFGVTEADFDRYHRLLLRFKPHYLYGYVSAVADFIRFTVTTKRHLPKSLKCLVTTAEILDPDTRRFLETTSGLPVFNEYGCGEVGSIAHQCEHGSLHVMSDNLILECIPNGQMPHGLGELVVTDLFNLAMPLIRYRLGDLGRLSDRRCACRRPYPVIEKIVGRAYDIIYDAAGASFHPESVLYVFEDLRRRGISLPACQAVQHRNGELTLNFETTSTLDSEVLQEVTTGFQKAFGNAMSIATRGVSKLSREASGKLRVVKREEPSLGERQSPLV